MNSRIFRGWTHHQRLEPVRHAFKYRIYWLGVDLDELDTLNRSVGGFGYNRWSLASMKAADYGGPGEGTLRDRVLERLGEHGIELGNTRIMLMTIPRLLGYVFNPVNFYVCLEEDGTISALLAEVRNTYGEMHHYAARPVAGKGPGESCEFHFPKRFHVSPFLEESGGYVVHVRCEADRFSAAIALDQGGRRIFSASMEGVGRPLDTSSLLGTLIRMPLAAATIMMKIQWQAIILRFRRGVRPHAKPEPSDPATIKSTRSSIWYWIRGRFVRYASRSPKGPEVDSAVEKERT